jgi:hypothetical protein
MSIISGFRPIKPIQYYHDAETNEIVGRWHDGKCICCQHSGRWEQYLECWTEDDNGIMQPDWEGSGAWHFDCPDCGSLIVDPYGDGLLRIYPEDYDIED